jgi:hypothetical protein
MFVDPLKVPLFDVLLRRRSRRVGLGMAIPAGPFQYTSPHTPFPLTEDEEAALAFAACGITGYAKPISPMALDRAAACWWAGLAAQLRVPMR